MNNPSPSAMSREDQAKDYRAKRDLAYAKMKAARQPVFLMSSATQAVAMYRSDQLYSEAGQLLLAVQRGFLELGMTEEVVLTNHYLGRLSYLRGNRRAAAETFRSVDSDYRQRVIGPDLEQMLENSLWLMASLPSRERHPALGDTLTLMAEAEQHDLLPRIKATAVAGGWYRLILRLPASWQEWLYRQYYLRYMNYGRW